LSQLNIKTAATPVGAAVDSAAFRAAMRRLPGGVSVITAGQGSDRTGMTVTSMSSLSVDPSTLIIAINRSASLRPFLDRYRSFGVSILRAGQKTVADRFAGVGGLAGNGRFIGEQWIPLKTGAPVLAAALAAFDCEVEEIIERHTHSIIIGLVRAVHLPAEGTALVHWQGQYTAAGYGIPNVDHDWEGA
jgi:flavin reductase (DIM6/NTAB) family NADH-FMN oxidoreductase RutF